LRQFAESAVQEGINITWDAFMRANMDLETARLLRRSGCESVFIGIESMSNETLALMKKRRTEELNVEALHAFLQAGIYVIAGVIPGFPRDDREAFVHTVEKLRDIQRTYPRQLRLNVEPFVVSPGQPLFASLQDFSLHGKPWDDEVLNSAPRYRDITEGIFCTVEGSNQGIERVGRLRMAESMESEDSERADTFDYKGDEAPGGSRLEFEFLRGGFYLARIKGPSAWIYAVIVNQAEKAGLEASAPDDLWSNEVAARSLRRRLHGIAKAHLVKPHQLPRFPNGGYFHHELRSAPYTLSPFVIARASDAALGHRIFLVDFCDLSWKLLPRYQGEIVQALSRAPQTAATVRGIFARSGHVLPLLHYSRILAGLAEEGFVLIAGRLPANQSNAGPSHTMEALADK
jgi:hypothetical protein